MKFFNVESADKFAKLSRLSFQKAYTKSCHCIHCQAQAFLIGVLDDEQGKELCRTKLYPEMKHWVHDSCSIAIYLCGDCLEVTAVLTQA